MTMTKKTFAANASAGPTMLPQGRVTSLQFNVWNMQVGRHKIGSSRWWSALIKNLVKLGYSELANVPFFRGKPAFLRGKHNSLRGLWNKSANTCPGKKRRGQPPRFNRRVMRILDLLKKCPLGYVSFVAVVTSIALTKEEALAFAKRDGERIDRFIRNRFDHPIWIMMPEVDLHLAKPIRTDLLADRAWRVGVADNRMVYKVHFHGIIYVPAKTASDVEAAFKTGRNGKRSKVYSGNNQVRAIQMDREPGNRTPTPDVYGVAGYATKTHYKPPVDRRMLEGFGEWVWLNHMITSDASLIRIGGFNAGIHHYCKSCDTHHRSDDDCECEPLIVEDDFYGFDDEPDATSSDAVTGEMSGLHRQDVTDDRVSGLSSILNSLGLTSWIAGGFLPFVEKLVTLLRRLSEAVRSVHFPRWTRGP